GCSGINDNSDPDSKDLVMSCVLLVQDRRLIYGNQDTLGKCPDYRGLGCVRGDCNVVQPEGKSAKPYQQKRVSAKAEAWLTANHLLPLIQQSNNRFLGFATVTYCPKRLPRKRCGAGHLGKLIHRNQVISRLQGWSRFPVGRYGFRSLRQPHL